MNPPTTSSTIIKALAAKHHKDVFVGECKDGPTWNNNHLRLDAWVLCKSWSRPAVIGYEVKVSRADFRGDHKWPDYLPLCNEFYFVAPKGLIQSAELPDEAGLIELLGTSRLCTRKKAPHREVAIPEKLYRYILMCRAQIVASGENRCDRLEYWREWLAERKECKDMGYQVSKSIRAHCAKVESENDRLRNLHMRYDDVRDLISKLGIDPERFNTWTVESKLKALASPIPDDLRLSLNRLQVAMQEVSKFTV